MTRLHAQLKYAILEKLEHSRLILGRLEVDRKPSGDVLDVVERIDGPGIRKIQEITSKLVEDVEGARSSILIVVEIPWPLPLLPAAIVSVAAIHPSCNQATHKDPQS